MMITFESSLQMVDCQKWGDLMFDSANICSHVILCMSYGLNVGDSLNRVQDSPCMLQAEVFAFMPAARGTLFVNLAVRVVSLM